MAPSVAEKTAPANTLDAVVNTVKDLKLEGTNDAPADNTAAQDEDKGPSYPAYVPHFDVSEKFPPLEIFEHSDPGLRADPTKPHLLANATTRDLSPYIGTELRGVQLSELTSEGLDELALLTAQRKLVVFRDQDFKDIGFERQIAIAKHFGPIQRHPTSGNVPGYPEFHVVYRDSKNDRFREYDGPNRLSRTQWHSDVSYEKQPPGTTLFWILDQPALGGDTQFLSQVEAYKRLSKEFRKRLEGLRAVHSAVAQAERSAASGGPVRREPIESEHPLVRQHPVTGEKALYVNQGFTRYIVGYKKEESDNLLNFLFDHLAKSTDLQVRANYEPGTVVVWDNRLTCHSATPDFEVSKERRHAVRLTPQAEVPVEGKVDED
ncbi:alpha-ketoglutarate catabolism dioxygenase [Calocera viscosa TUFC12733]|uniref:Alpha-ketoglutarate catabolism dioxygenase n=1 Tax=Calocera viscosa (strain TUFC12733) TaxID=1330018 RepID=A0A167FL67_CALVF|nr:alpha-ketoglutarate catabolism dioxygenase [Calocera viscosa TUFC12733]